MTRALAPVVAEVVLLCTCFAVSSPADEKPPAAKSAELTKDKRTAYSRALAKGRNQATAGNQVGAIAAFREALGAVPDDPAALSELGLAALRQKDYKTAESATRQAMTRIGVPAAGDQARLYAASAYNLGLILEAQGDRPKAIAAYVESLKVRPNQTVRERLISLDTNAAAAADSLAPDAMLGPFASVEQFCSKVVQPGCTEGEDGPPHFECHKLPEASVAKTTAPYRAVRIYSTLCDQRGVVALLQYHLAVQLQSGWWFAPSRFDAVASGHAHEKRTFPELAVKDLIPGGAPEVLVRSTSSGSWYNAGHYYESNWELEEWVVVGIGPSGKPSATPTILLKKQLNESQRTVDDERGEQSQESANLKLLFLKDGQIEISGKFAGEAVREINPHPVNRAGLLGKHLLNFP